MSKILTRPEIDNIIKDLRDKADVDETLEIIKDNILHFEDQDGVIIEDFSLGEIYLQVEYMRKTKRTAKIELSTEEPDSEEGEFIGDSEKVSLRYSNSINNFLEYLAISSEVNLVIYYELIVENLRVQELKNALLYLENICKIDGINFESPRLVFNYSRNQKMDFKFIKNLDPKKFQTELDPLDTLPSSIIDDFKKFAQKLNMKRSDKSELVNLLSGADWSKKDTNR